MSSTEGLSFMPHSLWHDTGAGAAIAGGAASAILFPGTWIQRAGAIVVGAVSAWFSAPIATPLAMAWLAKVYQANGVDPAVLSRDSVAGSTSVLIAIASIYVLTGFVNSLRARLTPHPTGDETKAAGG